MHRLNSLIVATVALLIACAPQPIEPTPDPTPTQESMQDAPKFLNANPELTLGKCQKVYWFDDIWGQVWVNQCHPADYELYELRRNGEGAYQKGITVPISLDYTGRAYSILPGGRAGRAGFESEPIRFNPGCYAMKLRGQLHLWGKPLDYGANIIIGDQEQIGKKLPANGMYELVWFWLAETETLTPITFYLSFAWGSATADSYATIERFEVLPVSLPHCQ